MNIKETYFSVKEVADILKVSRPAIHDRIKRKTVEFIKIGNQYVIPKYEVDRMISEKR